MLKARRLARIIEILREDGFASLGEIAERLGTSVSTVRRDVDHLADIGPVTRTHGGVVLNPGEALSFEPGSEIASEIESDAKAVIGRHAARYIEAGQTVLFDSGTTTREVARAALARKLTFTAFTNDVSIASLLSASDRIAVHVFHGRMRPGSHTLLGAETVADIGRMRADLVFIGTHAGTVDGVSDTSTELAAIKRAFLASAETKILVADRTKFPKRSLCLFARLPDFDRMIIDAGINSELANELRTQNPSLELAEDNAE